MTTSISIRRATPADISTLIDLRERMLIELGAADPERLSELEHRSHRWYPAAFADGRAVGWIAERDGRVVGGLSVTLTESTPQHRSPSGRVASIFGLFVHPEFRGEGTATRLVLAAVRFARDWGADLVTLHAADKARPLYERIGFVPTKEMRLQFSELQDDAALKDGGC
jgi:GNAT superfamily N-acetyltransferase